MVEKQIFYCKNVQYGFIPLEGNTCDRLKRERTELDHRLQIESLLTQSQLFLSAVRQAKGQIFQIIKDNVPLNYSVKIVIEGGLLLTASMNKIKTEK